MMNNYTFIRVVGKGSYGEVNLVKHKTDRKQYVIKKLNLTTSSKRERRSAEQEAQLLSQLRHPNIVTYRESWEGDDYQLYIVMGFCEGGDLYHRLKQQKGELLPERQVVEWFVQIAMALQYLHERNILHRDLKTQNIFLTKTNIIKVGDLGIARVLENQNDMASTLIGTPYYMSPELFSNKPYNHKSDVWALGCCVYEMSTLKHAFNAKDMNSLVYRIVEGKLPQMPSRYDPQLGDLIKSMLCKRPEERPDVKFILRQPYIKRQIAMFLEATKEKTAKSRKKAVGGSGDCKTNSASPVVSCKPKPEKQPPSPQPEPLARVKRKEDKSQQQKGRNGSTDCTPLNTPPPPKPSSPDALTASLATVSNINIDIQLQQDDDPVKKQVHRPQSVVSHHQVANEPATHCVYKDSRGRGKPDPSPPPSPVKPPLKSVSGVCSRGGDEKTASNGLLDIHPQGPSNPGETFCVFGEKQVSDVDEKDDTMELLKDADAQNPTLQKIEETMEENMDNKNDTVTLFKQAPAKHLHTSDVQDNLESTEKLLEPFPSTPEPVQREPPMLTSKADRAAAHQTPLHFSSEPFVSQQHREKHTRRTNWDNDKSKLAAPRPLPLPPVESSAAEGKKRSRRSTDSRKAAVTATSTSVGSSKDGFLPLSHDRPLSARERRRLRQSQDSASQPGVSAVRRASYDVAATKAEQDNTLVTRSVSDSITECNSKQDKLLEQRSDEDECSSSTSSTERSEGDCRERKTELNDIHDLVHMMTQTLRMDVGDAVNEVDKSRFGSTALPEFKLNRKYRDTLVLHGKAREEAENLSLGEIPIGSTSGPAKIRRAIEHLRTDVVKGLGVKLLDRVLEIMEEEDDVKRELCLRDQMGDEKYQTYAVMVRQLKFFEDIAFKV
ncbi:serine/threonine-protein kinase Nek4-like isoform X2 [Stegastes partitus]|uniref:Serine/threonine-protein kinase Nek4 n=2 Tax=Stegastes partitus TaxID=144197 RepID=A0A9Y4NR96_9TELE|nr:PREDICTED: serine/threonine-protein kinase Nek4 isoform X2 [Stegastes partitus]XP_008301980.1 PREDICTED: serine/threonine-protein kinase Nek4-like isoform X2 [Stegastes partitus]